MDVDQYVSIPAITGLCMQVCIISAQDSQTLWQSHVITVIRTIMIIAFLVVDRMLCW